MARLTQAIRDGAISAANRHGVPPSVLLGVWQVESGFDTLALGDLNADGAAYSYGIGQLHVKGAGAGTHPRKLLTFAVNSNVSARYLASCFQSFPENTRLAISAYNQGIGGAKANGEKVNKAYVDAVVAAAKPFSDLDKVKPSPETQRTHTVVRADNLWKIAARYYGDGREWKTIYDANVKIIGPDPDLIQPGQILTIP